MQAELINRRAFQISLAPYLESSIFSPQRSQGPQGSKHSQNTQNATLRVGRQIHDDVNPGNDHEETVHDIPRTAQVRCVTDVEAHGDDLGEDGMAINQNTGNCMNFGQNCLGLD